MHALPALLFLLRLRLLALLLELTTSSAPSPSSSSSSCRDPALALLPNGLRNQLRFMTA